MYEGSMIGAGSHVFAVMGYVIAHWRPDKEVGGQVRLNPDLLCHIIGEPIERINQAIDYLTAPDSKSTTPVEDGRRLIKIGQFDYRVVNAMKYHEIQSEEAKRESNRIRQQKHRDRARPGFSKRDMAKIRAQNESRETRYCKADERGDMESAEQIAAEGAASANGK